MDALSLLTADETAKRFNLPNAEFVKDLARKRKIPVVRIGHRTLRFNATHVAVALSKLEVKAVA